MSANVNKVVLAGTLTRDPETRVTPKGTSVCAFSLAINRTWKDEAGEKRGEVSFVECTAFGRTAEVIGEYFRKGGNILIEGRLKQEQWEDKATGKKRSAVKVIVEGMNFLGHNSSEARDGAPGARRGAIDPGDVPSASRPASKAQEGAGVPPDNDPGGDIPF